MVALVARALEYAEENEACGYGGVENSKENERGDHKRERDLLEDLVAQGSKGRSGHVLGAGVDVNNGADQAEDDDFGNGDGPKGFGEIGGIAHFGDETGNGDLTDERVADVEEGAEPVNERGVRRWDDQNSGRSNIGGGSVVKCWVWLDTGENRREEHRNEREERRESCQLRECVERSRQRAHKGNDAKDGGEANGAHAVVGHGVEIFGTNQDVETLTRVSFTA